MLEYPSQLWGKRDLENIWSLCNCWNIARSFVLLEIQTWCSTFVNRKWGCFFLLFSGFFAPWRWSEIHQTKMVCFGFLWRGLYWTDINSDETDAKNQQRYCWILYYDLWSWLLCSKWFDWNDTIYHRRHHITAIGF